MKRQIWSPVVLVLSAAAAVAADGPDLAVVREAVRQADLAMARAVADGDAGAFRSSILSDGVFLGGPEVLTGPDEVAAAWARFLDPRDPMALSWQPAEVAVAGDGELAYSIGAYLLRYPSPETELGSEAGEYLTVWSRGEDGRWRVAADGTLTSRDPEPLALSWEELDGLAPELPPGSSLAVELASRRRAAAGSGDLAYSLATRSVRAGAGGRAWEGAVLTVWSRDGAGPWRAVAESVTPLRPAGGG